ncbi:hypothetical protein NDU88_003965 [Pleurodeles waltl]|uniref:Uncharacterized protein n=1 Tax=Pleurodeles waltl TaxID=8319 RepID=A0AAV7M6I6_PLEWA|nr:hypothetical protein NDU88_003965 [Pleurodeles waltl]
MCRVGPFACGKKAPRPRGLICLPSCAPRACLLPRPPGTNYGSAAMRAAIAETPAGLRAPASSPSASRGRQNQNRVPGVCRGRPGGAAETACVLF